MVAAWFEASRTSNRTVISTSEGGPGYFFFVIDSGEGDSVA